MTNTQFSTVLLILCAIQYYLGSFPKESIAANAFLVATQVLVIGVVLTHTFSALYRKYWRPDLEYKYRFAQGERLDVLPNGCLAWRSANKDLCFELEDQAKKLIATGKISEQELHDKGYICPISSMMMQMPVRVLRACDLTEHGKLKINYDSSEPVHRFEASEIVNWVLCRDGTNPLVPSQKLTIKFEMPTDSTSYQVGDVIPDEEHYYSIIEFLNEKNREATIPEAVPLSSGLVTPVYSGSVRTSDGICINRKQFVISSA